MRSQGEQNCEQESPLIKGRRMKKRCTFGHVVRDRASLSGRASLVERPVGGGRKVNKLICKMPARRKRGHSIVFGAFDKLCIEALGQKRRKDPKAGHRRGCIASRGRRKDFLEMPQTRELVAPSPEGRRTEGQPHGHSNERTTEVDLDGNASKCSSA